jgi:tetratricopeptide (TPR) repeat protein
MKKFALIIMSIVFVSISLQAETVFDQLRSLVKSKDYTEAEKIIPEVIKQNPKDINAFMLSGDVYTELEKYDKAVDMFYKADDIDRNTTTMKKLGQAYSFSGNHKKAIEILKDAVKKDQSDVYLLLALGEAYIKADSIDVATLIITKAREKNKNIAEPYVALGNLYFAQKVYELAKNNYELALAIDDNNIPARIKLATAYYWMANKETDRDLSNELFNRSLKEWGVIAEKDPKNARAWWEQGRILYFGKRYDVAAGALKKYLQFRPDQSIARWYLAQSLIEVGQCDSAAPQLRQVSLEIDSVKNIATLKLAQCLFEQKQFQESLKEYESIKGIMPLDIKDLERMAGASLKVGDTTKTIVLYKELLGIDPTRCNLMFQLANLTIYMKRYDDAIFFLDKRNDNCKDSISTKVYYLLGTCYFSKERADTAEILLKKSVELDSNNLQAKVYLADVMASLGQKDEAKELFLNTITAGMADTAKFKREVTQGFQKLSNLLLDQKQFKELQTIGKQWTEFDPNSDLGWLYLGISYQGQADKDNACKCYKKGLIINPNNSFLKNSIKKLECNGN